MGPESLASPALQNTEGVVDEGRALFALVKARGMEGIVAKRLGSPYAPGRRTGAWIKVKMPGYAGPAGVVRTANPGPARLRGAGSG